MDLQVGERAGEERSQREDAPGPDPSVPTRARVRAGPRPSPSGNAYLVPAPAPRDAAPMAKPLRCILQLHAWRLITNDEGERYKQCERCGAYRDFTPVPGAS